MTSTLHIRALDTGGTVTVKRILAGSAQGDGLESPVVLASGRALWRASNHWSNQQYGFFVRTASIDDPVIRDLPCCDLYIEETDLNLPEFPIAGRGDMLVYYSHIDVPDCSRPPCTERAVRRAVDGRTRKLFDVVTPSYLAVDSGRIAVVWAPSRRGQLRSSGGNSLGSFRLERRPRALALSRSRLAVLTNGGQIELFRAASGSSLGSLRVPWRVAPMLAANDRWLVYAVGRAITGFDLEARRARVLAHATRKPFDLAVDSARVTWAEDVGERGGRVRVLLLPE